MLHLIWMGICGIKTRYTCILFFFLSSPLWLSITTLFMYGIHKIPSSTLLFILLSALTLLIERGKRKNNHPAPPRCYTFTYHVMYPNRRSKTVCPNIHSIRDACSSTKRLAKSGRRHCTRTRYVIGRDQFPILLGFPPVSHLDFMPDRLPCP